MYTTVRHSEGSDKVRFEEVTRKVGESVLPAPRKLPGFSGCYVFDDSEGVSPSIGLSRTRRRPTSRRASLRPGRVSRSSRQRFRTRPRSPQDP
jgi:hypothetical protein